MQTACRRCQSGIQNVSYMMSDDIVSPYIIILFARLFACSFFYYLLFGE